MTLEEVNTRLQELEKFLEQGRNEQQQLIGYRARLQEEEGVKAENKKEKK